MSNGILFAIVGVLGIALGIGASQLKVEPENPHDSQSSNSGDRPSRRTPDSPSKPTLSSAELESALGSISGSIDYGPLEGTIQGTVTDLDGNPVAGVRFSARPQKSSHRDLTPVEAARVALEDYNKAKALTRESTSDDAGKFAFTEIGGDRYFVSGEAPFKIIRAGEKTSLRMDQIGSKSARANAGDDALEFTAHPAAAVRVSVIDATGQEPETAKLQLDFPATREPTGSTSLAWSSERREILAPSESLIVLTAQTDDQTSSESQIDPVIGQTVEVTLSLLPRHGIRGQVFRSDGRLCQEVYIRFAPATGAPPTLAEAAELPQQTYGSSGHFELLDLDAGDYWIAASTDWNKVSIVERVTVSGIVRHDLQLPPPDLTKGVLIYAQGPDGAPLSDLRFSKSIRSGRGSSSGGGGGVPLGDGGYYVDFASDLNEYGTDESIEISVDVTSAQYGSKKIELTPSTLGRVDLVFDSPGFVDLQVTNVPGEFVGRVVAQLSHDAESNGWSGSWQNVSNEGQLRLGPETPGPCRIELGLGSPRHRGNSMVIASQEIVIRAGDQSITLAMPPLYPLTVRFPEGRTGSVSLQTGPDSMGMGNHQEIPPSGEVHYPTLPAGDYQLQVFGGPMEVMSITLPRDSVVDFVPTLVNALEITITDSSHPLVAQGFQSGDLIIAIDGKTFEGTLALQQAVVAVMTRESVPVTVVRGNSEITLNLDARSLARSPRGARVNPTTR